MARALQRLIDKYKNKKHPLDYQNIYQLIVLWAQDSDAHINKLGPVLFEKYANLRYLARAKQTCKMS